MEKNKMNTVKIEKQPWEDLDYFDVILMNDAMYYLEGVLSNVSKYNKKELDSHKYWGQEKKPISFGVSRLMGDVSLNFTYGWDDGDEESVVSVRNIKEGETLRYSFPYGNLKKPFLREKTASWIVEQTFLKILDEEKVKSFMREKCIYKDAHNIIVYK